MLARIRRAEIDAKTILLNQLQDCLKELSAFGVANEPYGYFAVYWMESNRWPYVIDVDGEIIGFVLVNQWSPSGQGTDYSVAEFYVEPRWRRQGHGLVAACQVFQNHPGRWEVAFFKSNLKAELFWTAATAKAGAASNERIDRPDSVILRFVIASQER